MRIEPKLDALRTKNPGCKIAAFGDLKARLILSSSGETRCPQEYFDDICDVAAKNFECRDALTQSMGQKAEPGGEILVVKLTETFLILRSETEESDMLVCVCDTHEDALHMMPPARDLLSAVSEMN